MTGGPFSGPVLVIVVNRFNNFIGQLFQGTSVGHQRRIVSFGE